jgi:hypothetical protein
MADLLTRLAQRALGVAPLVRPRVEGLFAPAGPEPDPAERHSIADDAAPLVQSREPEAAQPEPGPPRLQQKPEVRDHRPEAHAANASSPAADADPRPVRAPVASAAAESRSPGAQTAPPARQDRALEPPGPAAARRGQSTEYEARTGEERRGDRLTPRRSPSVPRPAPAPPHGRPEARDLQSETWKSEIRDRRPEIGMRRAAEVRPVIHVTIGRVEVRAVQPQPAPLRPAPPGPKLTLEEYLRQRDKGER